MLFFAPAIPVMAGEHPEHPQSQQLQQQRQRQMTGGETKQVTTAEISTGIRKDIKSESKKDGKFHVKYEGNDLALELVKVHDDRLSNLGGGKYFACVDMKAADTTTYDIDFFMTGKPGNMKVTETSVHKVNGKPLYNWKEKGGVWKKVATS
jgi:hypothetical protein